MEGGREGRKDGGQEAGASKEAFRQPSRGDGTRSAQSVSLTPLPDTGWLTHNHTLFL